MYPSRLVAVKYCVLVTPHFATQKPPDDPLVWASVLE
jgi:hypothetical protein